MMSARLFSAVLLSATVVGAESSAPWLRSAPAAVMNPNISVVGDFVALAGPRSDGEANRLSLREAELAFQANVDPYARADFFVAFPDGESAELEEAYVTLLHLPWGLQARGGKVKANFGRMNIVHGHERPQVDAPFVVDQYLGEEGLRDVGAEVSRIFAPFGIFTEFSYGLLNGLGEEEEDDAPIVTVTGLDGDGNTVTVPVAVAQDEAEAPRTLRNFAQVARLRFYGDLTDAANVDVGVSGALHQPEGGKQVRMAGADLTFRWRPAREGLYRGFLWRTEGIASRRVLAEETDLTGAVVAGRRPVSRKGLYSYVEWQPARRWKLGVRGDYSEDPEAADEVFLLPGGSARRTAKSISRGVSPCVTFALTEFHRLRLEVQRKTTPSGETEDRGWLQWTIVLGPHGGHPF